MRVSITGRHMEMTDALKAYIENGLNKLGAHFDKVIDADVILDIEKRRHIAEVNLHANGVRIHGKEASPDMYASVDAVLAKLEKQIRKYKDRINRHQPRADREDRDYGHVIITMESETDSSDTNGTSANHKVVHREQLPMKPLSVEEAIMQLELLDEPFLVFSNADTSKVNVLYAREDGTYGLIEPQF
ncbi:MAG: ribosome-associated translation inhibitor RaiA [Candidatus Hydrogenedentes bacterium]|nr:ribosome-associated translation inhibitor RaiA [Candidatus Hydrogenedentota bacterium]